MSSEKELRIALLKLTEQIDQNGDNLDPNVVYLIFGRGNIHYQLGDFEKAVQDYSKAIELIPQASGKLFFNRGSSYLEMKEYEKAVQDYSKAIELNPQYINAYYNRGATFRRLRVFEKAVQDYSKAIELNPQHSGAYNSRGNAYQEMKENEKAVEDYSKAIELKPQDFEVYNNRGNVFRLMSAHGKAVRDFSKAIELNPQYINSYYNRGLVYDEMEEYERAIQDYSKAIEMNPQDSEVYCNRGNTFSRMDDEEKAISDYSRAIVINSQYGLAYYNRGSSYLQLEQYNEALVDFDKAIEFYPKFSHAYYNRGMCYQKLGDVEKSEMDLQTAQELAPGRDLRFDKDAPTVMALRQRLDEFGMKILQLQKRLKTTKFEDLEIIQRLGEGAFAHTYLCNVKGEVGKFVLKIYKNIMSEEKIRDVTQKDGLYLKYHPNLITILAHRENDLIDTKRLPDYESYWKSEGIVKMQNPTILMMYYPENLLVYVTKKKNLISSDVANLLQGVINGVSYLNENFIVHRDLHPENILVDEKLGRVCICDYGCSLDLRMNHCSFLVDKKHEKMFSLTGSFKFWKVGGNENFLPPEILSAKKEDEHGFIDYSKSDLYSIGVLGKFLLNTVLDRDEKYHKLERFVEMFLKTELDERIDFNEAVIGIRNLILMTQETRNSGSETKKKVLRKLRKCQNCGKRAGNVCRECKKVFYCCRKCQLKDWKTHKKQCKK